MSIDNDQHVDMNIDNYSPNDLFQILNIEDPTIEEIENRCDDLISKFKKEGNEDLEKFFIEAKERLLKEIKGDNDTDLVSNDNKYNLQNSSDKQLNAWWSEQALAQNDSKSSKTTERKQRIDIYDSNQNVMKRERLEIGQGHGIPIIQGQMNPNLKNINTRLVNIDSQFRQNTFPIKGEGKIDDVSNPHTSIYSSTSFTVDLTDTLSNVTSLKLYSITIPYTWYNIDKAYGNNCFKIIVGTESATIVLDSGNYYSKTDDPSAVNNIYTALNEQLTTAPTISAGDMGFALDELTGKTIFINNTGNPVTLLWYSPPGEHEGSTTGCESSCFSSMKANSNLGFLLGFRDSKYIIPSMGGVGKTVTLNYFNPPPSTVNSDAWIMSESIIDLNGPKYLLLIIDDYNHNHLNKGLVSIQDVTSVASMPSYFDPNLPCSNVDADSNNLNSYPQYGILPSADAITTENIPKRLTNAQQQTINGIIKDRSQTTSYKLKSVTESDIFALIPVKKNINMAPGEGIVEFSGPIQKNERIYFGPVDIDRMRIKLVTDKGDILNLNNNDWSFCMIAETLYQY